MPSPRLYAGQVLTADRHNILLPTLITQENDQTVNNSITAVASEITFTPEPNAIYEYHLFISYSAETTPGFFWNWDAPGALIASFPQSVDHVAAAGDANTGQLVNFRRPGNTTNRQAGGTGTAASDFLNAQDRGTFATDGTISAITMKFAQVTATVADTILRGGNQTRMLYKRIA